MTMGSLFDGIGGFPLAAQRNGITTLWASEIEPFPIRVTKLRFPEMVHLGDITKLDGAKLSPVDIICGGSPCQDLSVAGARAGLAGSRSGLFMEQIRITREMRDEQLRRGRTAEFVRPRYFAWENVPGSFSSGETYGEDFRIVLEETCRIADRAISVPRPPSGRWEPAGAILGTGFSLAWRVLDAQYWPQTPQRRRRIFLIADLGGTSAPEILFEQSRLFGDTAEGEEAREGAAAPAPGGAGTSGGDIFAFHINQREETINLSGVAGALMATPNMQMQTFVAAGFCPESGSNARSIGYQKDRSPTLKAGGKGAGVLCFNDQGGRQMDCTYDRTATLRAQTRGHEPLVFENHSLDSRYTGLHEAAPTISAAYGTGGNNTSFVVEGKDAADPPRLIRRLTPLECERLQGFPDGWTEIPGASDSARYKALGNSVAIPCVEYLLRGVAFFLRNGQP